MKYMLTESEEKIIHEWTKYAGYTVRPLPSTVHYYQSTILSRSALKHAMIYGGTPEIRGIFQQIDRSVILLDRSPQMVKAMGYLTPAKQAIACNEKYIEGDWLDMDKLSQGFDLLIGDDAINMLPWSQFKIFLQNAYRLLKRGGIFICHLLVKPDECFIGQNVGDIYSAYTKGSIQSIYDLASRLNFTCYDRASYRMGWQQTIAALGEENLALFKPSLDFIATFGLCNSYFYCPPQAYFEAMLKSYFYIDEIFYPHEHDYCQFEPVYVLKKP